jgi:hypothetical protein
VRHHIAADLVRGRDVQGDLLLLGLFLQLNVAKPGRMPLKLEPGPLKMPLSEKRERG